MNNLFWVFMMLSYFCGVLTSILYDYFTKKKKKKKKYFVLYSCLGDRIDSAREYEKAKTVISEEDKEYFLKKECYKDEF